MDEPLTSRPRQAAHAGFWVLVTGAVMLVSLGLPRLDFFPSASRSYVYPLMGPRVSSDFGNRIHPVKRVIRHHDGMDLAAPFGAPVRSIADGIVIFADNYAGYGRLVVIKHANGLTSHYGHLQEIKARPGQHIKGGQLIATVGSSGISTGPHLHFELRREGQPEDPEKYLPGLALPGQG